MAPKSTTEPPTQEQDFLQELQPEEQRTLLDTIDKLRDLKLDGIKLPQLVVVGDQSCGKSSVLDAISGVRFPSKPGTCTTFATEVILRKDSNKSGQVSIQPGNCDPQLEAKLRSFNSGDCSSVEDVPLLIKKAAQHIQKVCGYDPEDPQILDHRLKVRVTGPNVPPLTLVDLPGIIHTERNRRGGENEKTAVLQMVKEYMRNEQAIILTVVSAKYDHPIQAILTHAREADPEFKRTFGIITQPDEPRGSAAEAYISLAKGENSSWRQPWHVVRNRSEEVRASSWHNALDFAHRDLAIGDELSGERSARRDILFYRGQLASAS